MPKPGSGDDGERMAPAPGLWAPVAYTNRRCFVWGTGANLGRMVAPSAGGPIDGVCSSFHATNGYYATPGVAVSVEAGGAFSAGVDLETLADGRVVQKSSGRTVLRALEGSAGAGSIVWASFRN